MTDLSVVVVTWNARELVLDCLASIDREMRARNDPDRLAVEVIVVDNGSEDGSAAAVRERAPWTEVIALPHNLGFAAGNNAGIGRAKGRFVALLNNDTRVLRDGLERCVRFLEAHPDVGVVGPQLLHPDGRVQTSIHACPRLATELLPRWLREGLFPRRFPSKRSVERDPVDVEALLGACLVVRREVIDAVGPLPEDYFLFLEETDWCLRIRRAGWRIVHLPQAGVVHLHGATSKKRDAARTRIEFHRSLYRFLRAHRGRAQTASVVALRVGRTMLAWLFLAPAAAVSRRERARWKERGALLAWHLRGCPAAGGLAPARGEEGV